LAEHGLPPAVIDYVGFHGQTVWHEPPGRADKDGNTREQGRTVQLGDAGILSRGLGLPVVYDFRTADVAAGGQGAPLAPIYHDAIRRWSKLDGPLAVLNLGGVGNITLIGAGGELTAFDTGPANGMIDLWVQARTHHRLDMNGALARAGKVDEAVLAGYLNQPYFQARGAKSLDRYDFSLEPVAQLSLEDGASTLTAFAAAAVALAVDQLPERPGQIVATGGGRLNPVLLREIARRTQMEVAPAEAHGWRGDAIEAEAFAYLAARVVRRLPISFPGTTGVSEPMRGGKVLRP
jgi:anhydro-N-acetylmuramic acid kinase